MLYVRDNRLEVFSAEVRFPIYQGGFYHFCHELTLNYFQTKALLETVDFSKTYQTFKLGYLTDKLGLSDIKVWRLLKYTEKDHEINYHIADKSEQVLP